jgi:hypothetical protein
MRLLERKAGFLSNNNVQINAANLGDGGGASLGIDAAGQAHRWVEETNLATTRQLSDPQPLGRRLEASRAAQHLEYPTVGFIDHGGAAHSPTECTPHCMPWQPPRTPQRTGLARLELVISWAGDAMMLLAEAHGECAVCGTVDT